MKYPSAASACLAIVLVALQLGATGCRDAVRAVTPSWHTRFGWDAEEYFDDPQVVALCEAIEADDLAEMKRLIQAGADVNARGKDNMTPLLWAYPDNKLARFKLLLEQGADPNVIIESDFNTRGQGIRPGDSVTHMASKTAFPGYFEAVFNNGGDPNLANPGEGNFGATPLLEVIKWAPNKRDKIQLLLEKGADINQPSSTGITPVRTAVGWGAQFELALMLLEANADFDVYGMNNNSKLIHRVVEEEPRASVADPEQKAAYSRLVQWLENHGESVDKAKADMERWESWSMTTGEYKREMAAEVSKRKQRERRERKAAEVENEEAAPAVDTQPDD